MLDKQLYKAPHYTVDVLFPAPFASPTEISDTLYIFLHLSPATNREGTTEGNLGDLRFYMSDLYCQCWDLCCLHKNLGLDVRILHEGGGYIARRELMVNKDLEVIVVQEKLKKG